MSPHILSQAGFKTIHTRFPFQIASSQAVNQKSSGFCVFRFQTNFDERKYFVLSSLYRNIAFIAICELRTRHLGSTRASIIFSSHWSLCSKRPPRLAMHPFRRFVTSVWLVWPVNNETKKNFPGVTYAKLHRGHQQ